MFMGASTKQGYDIADKSREIVRSLISEEIKNLSNEEKDIVERIVHSTADPEYAKLVLISSEFVNSSLKALKNNEDILTDINMVKSGITQYDGNVECFIKNSEVVDIAKDKKITRAAAAIEFAAQNDFKGIIVVGNAPTALYKAIELYNNNELDVSSIVGVPVGFVGAADSKEELKNSSIPNIITKGPKGGTPVAVACVNSLIQTMKNINK
ncbi:precorrin-8X methylmutase [Methanobrevibacter arboriphilus]|uniref:Precorrin-8X methylmutase n=1 Tax=Methanobrevibacter arboriphilus TaxID=39441 RepID=A0ACA8R1J0_METAZ|nr:cobalt-precorrin-8 methylmutase [Methanobrevibacter arboriphilus]BBL61416.1 precorrin-8X methylmutase [Methanobrevibacter arboriphilus]GLI11251.1 precorrin-8X methylmutase [Methanobrevibacter arboriphilus]